MGYCDFRFNQFFKKSKQLLSYFKNINKYFIPVILYCISTVYFGYVSSLLIIFSILIFYKKNDINITLFLFLMATLFLSNNNSYLYNDFKLLRYVLVALSFFILLIQQNLKFKLSFYIIPFSIISFISTIILNDFSIESALVVFSFFLMFVIIHSYVSLFMNYKQEFFNIILKMSLIFLLLNFFYIFFAVGYLEGRFRGLFGNPNGIAMYLFFNYTIFDFIQHNYKNISNSKLLNILKFLSLIMLFISASRTSLIVFLLFIFLTAYYRNKSIRVAMSFIFLIALSFLILIDINYLITSLISNEAYRTDTLFTLSGRTEVWPVVVEKILDEPWFGNGLQFDRTYIKDYADRYIGQFRERHWSGVWNSYLSILLNVGIIGLITYLFSLYKLIINSKVKTHALIFLICICLIGLTESWMSSSLNPFTPLMLIYFSIQYNYLKPSLTKIK